MTDYSLLYQQTNLLRRRYEYLTKSMLGIPPPRGSLVRFLIVANAQPITTLLPEGPQRIVAANSLAHEILDDLPFKPNTWLSNNNQRYQEIMRYLNALRSLDPALTPQLDSIVATSLVYFDTLRELRRVSRDAARKRYDATIQELIDKLWDPIPIIKPVRCSILLVDNIIRLRIGGRNWNVGWLRKLHKRYSGQCFHLDALNLFLRYLPVAGEKSRNIHAALPVATFAMIQKELGAETELFSSPFNVTLLHYYSLFPDTDQVFGSRGNFFTANIPPGSYTANPPYTEPTFRAMVDKFMFLLEQPQPYSITCIIPGWDDNEDIHRLIDSRYNKAWRRLLAQSHYFIGYDILGKERNFTSINDNYFIILQNPAWTNSHPVAANIDAIIDTMSVIYNKDG